jgi:hypothetical protein
MSAAEKRDYMGTLRAADKPNKKLGIDRLDKKKR